MRTAPTLWAEEAPLEPWPTLSGEHDCEVLVVGAGLAGLSIAIDLAQRGADVLVVEADAPGAGASARNAGFVLVTHPWQYAALRARVGVAQALETIAIARRTHARIESLLEERPPPSPLPQAGGGTPSKLPPSRLREGARGRAPKHHHRDGSLMLATDADEQAALEGAAELLAQDGVATEWVTPPPSFTRALRVPEDGEVHPGALVAALARQVARRAIGRIESLDVVTRRAQTEGATITFERVVVATNAWARELVPELDGVIVAQRAQVLVTAPLDQVVLDRPCYSTWGYDYFRQRADGSLLLGGRRHLHRAAEQTEHATTSEPVQSDIETFLRERLHVHAPVARRWAGIMGFTPDELPLVGTLQRAPWVTLLAGFSGHGVGLAMGCAERLAQSIERGEPSIIPSCMRPDRFAL